MSTATKFWDKHAPGYAAKPVADLGAYEAMLAEVRKLIKPSDHVLEIGCGTGTTAIKLAPCVSSMTATDFSAGMTRIARSKLTDAAPRNVSFKTADAQELIDRAPFDVVLTFSMLHLIKDIPAVLAAVREQLRPGGLFISKTVCLGDRSVWIRMMVRVLRVLGIAPYVAPLTREELEALIGNAGFKLVRTSYFDKRKRNPFIVAERI